MLAKDHKKILCFFLEIVFPKYWWATVVDIEASYKSVPAISYSKYDQVYTSMQKQREKGSVKNWSTQEFDAESGT